MGVDFSPGGARWAYSGFNRFRHRLARQLGTELEAVWESRPMEKTPGGEWRDPWRPGDEPLFLLLNHSDCDGTLTADECGLVAPRLLQVIRNWVADEWDAETAAYDRENACRLVEGMVECIRTGADLRFH